MNTVSTKNIRRLRKSTNLSNELYVAAFKEELDDKGLLVFCNVGVVENLAIHRARKMAEVVIEEETFKVFCGN